MAARVIKYPEEQVKLSSKGALSMTAMRDNPKSVAFVHTVLTIYTGLCAGTLGLTGLKGFLLFVVGHVVSAAAVMFVRMGGQPGKYLKTPTSVFGFLFGGIMSHLLTYLLFWTLSFALVHIYE